jgi:hypothetical protein
MTMKRNLQNGHAAFQRVPSDLGSRRRPVDKEPSGLSAYGTAEPGTALPD